MAAPEETPNAWRRPEMQGKRAYLLELLDGTLVDSTALVDQVCMPYQLLCPAFDRLEEGLRPVVVDFPESTWPMTTTLI